MKDVGYSGDSIVLSLENKRTDGFPCHCVSDGVSE
jgi:hypothetical protein